MTKYAICNATENDEILDTIARVEANNLMEARLIALRYGDDCIAVLEYAAKFMGMTDVGGEQFASYSGVSL